MTDAPPPDDWIARFITGDRRALSRAIAAVENGTKDAGAVMAAALPRLGKAAVVGFTGAPGAGKSTLVAAYVQELRRRGKGVGVIAVDPSSARTGGAVLGDRVRMEAHNDDPGVYVRSLASRGSLGGLSLAASRIIDLMDAAGRDVVVVETVGTGQSEIDVADLVDTVVLVAAPGMGDGVQAIKGGVMEIADVIALNKSDLPGADEAARQFGAALMIRGGAAGGWTVPVVATHALGGRGVAELADRIFAHRAMTQEAPRRADPLARARKTIVAAALRVLGAEIEAAAETGRLARDLIEGRLGLDEATEAAITTALGRRLSPSP